MSFDLDVILAAHGAGDGSHANALVHECARRLESTVVGARVRAAFNRGAPSFGAALERADRPDRLVVPLLTSDGHYSSLLRNEAERARIDGVAPRVAEPVGTHPALVETLVARITETLAQRGLDPANTVVILVGHGTARHAGSGTAARSAAEAIARAAGLRVHAAFLDERPSVEDVVGALEPDSHLIVVPFLLGGGHHAARDLPSRLDAAAELRGFAPDRIAILDPLGTLPVLGGLLERIVRESRGARLSLAVGARASLLSRRQVELVAAELSRHGVDLRLVAIETRGDRDRSTPIDELGSDDPFTDAIDDALSAGRIDLAIHSLKDLPLVGTPGIVDAAILPRGSAHDVLVTRTGARMSTLPAGSRVGTSCARRASQIRRFNRDLVPVPIRGDVPARIAAVDRGEVDAVVLAAAGLERLGLHDRIAEHLPKHRFVPAPAQGAVVVQCREDSPHRALLRRIDHPATRLAVTSERSFARWIASRDGRVPAAHARVVGDQVRLGARLIDARSLAAWDTTVCGTDPERVGALAAAVVLTLGAGHRRSSVRS